MIDEKENEYRFVFQSSDQEFMKHLGWEEDF